LHGQFGTRQFAGFRFNLHLVLYAILADVHANATALAAVLTRAEELGARQLVFLGDLVGYGPDPRLVMSEAIELVAAGAIIVQGNHDEAAVTGQGEMHSVAAEAIKWTHAQLSASEKHFLAELPLTAEHEELLFVHAEASHPARWTYITERNAALRSMKATHHRITFCGHVHSPQIHHVARGGTVGDYKPVEGKPIPLAGPRQWLSVFGAVGQPRDGNPAACLTLYDSSSKVFTLVRVPYDVDSVVARIRSAGLPERLAARLPRGV
jgi:diadenosine tetraphosphatase ApaH/serine/threonine PP2A family protein phosphatase